MHLTLKTEEGSKALLASAIGFIIFQFFYFGVALPISSIRHPIVFSLSFCVWAGAGIFAVLRYDISPRKKTQRLFQIFVVMIFVSVAASGLSPYTYAFVLAWTGFYIGNAIGASAILVYRVKNPNQKASAPDDYKW